MTDLNRRHLAGLIAASPLLGRAAAAGTTPVRLSLNENPYGPSPNVLRTLRDVIPQAGRYGDPAEADALVRQIATLERVAPEQVVLGELLEVLGLFLAARGAPGGDFVYSVPGYPALVDAGRPVGARVIGVPLDASLGNDLPALTRAVNAGTKALYLVNPHNPSGVASDPNHFERFLADVSRRTLVIVDEAYIEYAPRARSAVALTRSGANVAVFRTLDKIYGLAGLPVGYLLAPPPLVHAFQDAGFGDAHGIGRLPIAAARAALADQAWVAQVRTRIAAGRTRLTRTLDELGLRHTDSQANFVFFESPLPVPDARQAFADHGLLVGKPFPPLDRWIRVSIGTEEDVTRTDRALREIFRTTR